MKNLILNPEISNYISERYCDLFFYASYHCEKAGIAERSWMILNDVLSRVIKKPEDILLSLFNEKNEDSKYNELDFYILQSIKHKVYKSDTSIKLEKKSQVFKTIKIVGTNGILNTVIYPKHEKSFLGIYTTYLNSGEPYLILSTDKVIELRNYLNEILTGIKE